MKRLILLRHAKSSWVNPDLDDFDRPLNKRGLRSAKALGKWLRGNELSPGAVLCSSARRTRETWERLSLEGEPELLQDLYHAGPDTMMTVLCRQQAQTVLMIAHNPGIATLAHRLVQTPPAHPRFADYPTGALLVAEFDLDSWTDLAPGTGHVRAFLTPRDLTETAD